MNLSAVRSISDVEALYCSFLPPSDVNAYLACNVDLSSRERDKVWRQLIQRDKPTLTINEGRFTKENYFHIQTQKKALEPLHTLGKEVWLNFYERPIANASLALSACLPISWTVAFGWSKAFRYQILPLLTLVATIAGTVELIRGTPSEEKASLYGVGRNIIILSAYALGAISSAHTQCWLIFEIVLRILNDGGMRGLLNLDRCAGIAVRLGALLLFSQSLPFIDSALEWMGENSTRFAAGLFAACSADFFRRSKKKWFSGACTLGFFLVAINQISSANAKFIGLSSLIALVKIGTAEFAAGWIQTRPGLPGERLANRVDRIINNWEAASRVVMRVDTQQNEVTLEQRRVFVLKRMYVAALSVIQLGESYRYYHENTDGGFGKAVTMTVTTLPAVFSIANACFRNSAGRNVCIGKTMQKVVAVGQAILASLREPEKVLLTIAGAAGVGAAIGIISTGVPVVASALFLVAKKVTPRVNRRSSFCEKVSLFAQKYLQRSYEWVSGFAPEDRLRVATV